MMEMEMAIGMVMVMVMEMVIVMVLVAEMVDVKAMVMVTVMSVMATAMAMAMATDVAEFSTFFIKAIVSFRCPLHKCGKLSFFFFEIAHSPFISEDGGGSDQFLDEKAAPDTHDHRISHHGNLVVFREVAARNHHHHHHHRHHHFTITIAITITITITIASNTAPLWPPHTSYIRIIIACTF